MSDKTEVSCWFIVIAVVVLGYVAFGLFIAFKHEFKSGSNYIKDDIILKQESIRDKGKDASKYYYDSNYKLVNSSELKDNKCTECNQNKNND